jgi:hypothetical protein
MIAPTSMTSFAVAAKNESELHFTPSEIQLFGWGSFFNGTDAGNSRDISDQR